MIVHNAEDQHFPACNNSCHGDIHYLKAEDSMGHPVHARVTCKIVEDERGVSYDLYVNGKFAQRVEPE